jgi:hypothetical protein
MCKLARFRDSILVSNRPALTPSFSKDCVGSEAAALTKIFSNFLSGCDRVEWPANKSVRGGFGKELGILKGLSKSQSAERVKASLPKLARKGPPGMSARWSLSEEKRTSCGQPISVENDPNRTFADKRAPRAPSYHVKLPLACCSMLTVIEYSA